MKAAVAIFGCTGVREAALALELHAHTAGPDPTWVATVEREGKRLIDSLKQVLIEGIPVGELAQ